MLEHRVRAAAFRRQREEPLRFQRRNRVGPRPHSTAIKRIRRDGCPRIQRLRGIRRSEHPIFSVGRALPTQDEIVRQRQRFSDDRRTARSGIGIFCNIKIARDTRS